jgi:hypothetical protein
MLDRNVTIRQKGQTSHWALCDGGVVKLTVTLGPSKRADATLLKVGPKVVLKPRRRAERER